MTIAEISEVVESYFFNNWTQTPIAWENVPFNANVPAWVRFTNLPDMASAEELGEQGICIREGSIIIQVFTQAGKGSREGATLASDIEALFNLKDIGNVKFKSAYSINSGIDDTGNWFQHTVTCPYWTWVNE